MLLFNHNVERSVQVAFTQIRLGFSSLKNDLYPQKCTPDAEFECSAIKEDAHHFFLQCNRFNRFHNDMLIGINEICKDPNLSVALLLYSSDMLSHEDNMKLFRHVHEFIDKTHRF